MASTSSLHQAIAINNEGVQLLFQKENDLVSCLPEFQRAILLLKALDADVNDDIPSLPCVPSDPFEEEPSSPSITKGSCFEQRPSPLTCLQSEHYYVYDRAILLPDQLTISNHKDQAAIGLMARVSTIFNLALVCHCHGIRTSRQVYLLKAGKLYDMVVQILDGTDNVNNNGLGVLKCLALNNCAEIHYGQGDYQACFLLMESMDDLLQYDHCQIEQYLDEDEAYNVRLNAEHRQIPSVAGAA